MEEKKIEKITKVIVNAGSSDTKALLLGNRKEFMMPSSLGEGMIGDDDDFENVYTFSSNGKTTTYTISDSVEKNFTDNPDYQFSEHNAILIQHALRRLGVGGKEIELHVTLPITDFYEKNRINVEKKKKAIKENLVGVVYKGKNFKPCEVKNVVVHPEGIPQIIDVFYQQSGDKFIKDSKYKVDKVLVLDIGGYTIDCCIVQLDDEKPIILNKEQKAYSVKDHGILKMKQYLLPLLEKKLEVPNISLTRKRFDTLLKTSVFRDVDVVDEIKLAADRTFSPAVMDIYQNYNQDKPEAILIVGGGAKFIEEFIKSKFPFVPVIIPNDPHLSLLRGIEKLINRDEEKK